MWARNRRAVPGPQKRPADVVPRVTSPSESRLLTRLRPGARLALARGRLPDDASLLSAMASTVESRLGFAESPTPFVVFGDDWGRHVSTTQHIFRRLARDHPTIWLNAINHRTPKLSVYDAGRAVGKVSEMFKSRVAVARSERAAQIVEEPNRGGLAGLVSPRILPWHNVKPIRYLNTRSLLRDVRGAIARAGQHQRPILLTATPAIPDVVRELDACLKIYFCIDDYGEIQGVDKELVLPLEQETLTVVDAVVATAQSLVASKRAPSGRGYYLPQGVNYDNFARRQPLPTDLAAIPRPRIGFAGNLTTVCDIGLMRGLAESHPEWSLVLVGPVNVNASALALPNVHILGNRSYAKLPGYVQGFDVGIIPYVLNAWTRAVDPLKTLEYLAAGIPVVSLPLPEIYKYAPPVRVAEGRDAFGQAIGAALIESVSMAAARRALAREHTWERRASRLLQIVHELQAECAR